MVFARVWPYLRGYAIIKIKGRSPEKFINLAAERGIYLWDVKPVGDRFIMARVARRDLRALGPILRRTNCWVELDSSVGFPFIWARITKRAFLLAGGIGFCAVLYLLSSFIWFIEIDGLDRLNRRDVMRFVKGTGAKVGTLKSHVDLDALERKMLARFSDIAWVGADMQGTILRIKVVEKEPVPEREGAVRTVARCDGLITSIIPLTGDPLVKEGDTVTRGQVLINGRGLVLARVWREVRGEAKPVDMAPDAAPREALELARARAREALEATLAREASRRRELLNTREKVENARDGTVMVKITVETLEDIGVTEPVPLSGMQAK